MDAKQMAALSDKYKYDINELEGRVRSMAEAGYKYSSQETKKVMDVPTAKEHFEKGGFKVTINDYFLIEW